MVNSSIDTRFLSIVCFLKIKLLRVGLLRKKGSFLFGGRLRELLGGLLFLLLWLLNLFSLKLGFILSFICRRLLLRYVSSISAFLALIIKVIEKSLKFVSWCFSLSLRVQFHSLTASCAKWARLLLLFFELSSHLFAEHHVTISIFASSIILWVHKEGVVSITHHLAISQGTTSSSVFLPVYLHNFLSRSYDSRLIFLLVSSLSRFLCWHDYEVWSISISYWSIMIIDYLEPCTSLVK